MKKHDIINILNQFDDEDEIIFRHIERIPEQELIGVSYPYPFRDIDFSLANYGDQSYSEKHGYIELVKDD